MNICDLCNFSLSVIFISPVCCPAMLSKEALCQSRAWGTFSDSRDHVSLLLGARVLSR